MKENSLFRSSIAAILIDLNEKTPQKVLVTDAINRVSIGGQKTTVQSVFEGACALAMNLQAQGFLPDDRVAIAAPPDADFIKIMYALIFLKAKVAIIDPEMGRDNYRSKLAQFDPKWAFEIGRAHV